MLCVFTIRSDLKKKLHISSKKVFIRERDVWFIHMGTNIGNEQNGVGENFLRPVLVIKKVGNMYFVAPMTTGGKNNEFYYTLSNSYFYKTSRVILSQVKCIDKNRFSHKITKIKLSDFIFIKKKLIETLL